MQNSRQHLLIMPCVQAYVAAIIQILGYYSQCMHGQAYLDICWL